MQFSLHCPSTPKLNTIDLVVKFEGTIRTRPDFCPAKYRTSLRQELIFLAKSAPFAKISSYLLCCHTYIASDPRLLDFSNLMVTSSSTSISKSPEPAVEKPKWGQVDVIFEEERQVGVYRLCILPQERIPRHIHARTHEVEMVVTDTLLCQEKLAPLNSSRAWPQHTVHTYKNPSQLSQLVLCIDTPPFDPDDEILV